MKLPNHYGTISKLSGNRRRPYVVKEGQSGKQRPIGYAATRQEGLTMLAEYNRNPWDIDRAKMTLGELFDLWKEKKSPKLGPSNRRTLYAAYRYCASLADKPYNQIKAFEMQDCIDTCGKGPGTEAGIKNLWGHLDRFAMELDVVTRCYSDLLTSTPLPETNRKPFTPEEISRLWAHQAEPWVDTVLIFLYSGWRISELLALAPEDIDLTAGTMKGGVKTKAGKNRIVPIHSKIRSLVEIRLAGAGPRLICYNGKPIADTQYRVFWGAVMDALHMKHMPHECRHTFETLLDSAGANRVCIDRLMGHKSSGTGERVYTHKTIDELRTTVELITI